MGKIQICDDFNLSCTFTFMTIAKLYSNPEIALLLLHGQGNPY